jgi:hypothetical protein
MSLATAGCRRSYQIRTGRRHMSPAFDNGLTWWKWSFRRLCWVEPWNEATNVSARRSSSVQSVADLVLSVLDNLYRRRPRFPQISGIPGKGWKGGPPSNATCWGLDVFGPSIFKCARSLGRIVGRVCHITCRKVISEPE